MDYLNSVNLNAGSDLPFLLMDINRGKAPVYVTVG